MAERDAAIGAGAGWASDAALDAALGRHRGRRCACCGEGLRQRGGCLRCANDETCRAIGCWAGDDGDHDDDRRRDGAGRV